MSARQIPRSSIPVLALRREDAAWALGVSPDTFDRHIAHDLKTVRVGSLSLYPVAELQRWLDGRAEPLFRR